MWLSTLVAPQSIKPNVYGNSLKVSVSNRTEVGIRLLNDNFTIPAGETGGFTLGNDVPGPEAGDKTLLLPRYRRGNWIGSCQ